MSLATDFTFTPPARTRVTALAVWAALPLGTGLLALAWWGLSRFLPDAATVHVLGRTVTLQNIHDRVLGDAALVLAILPGVLWLECAIIGWKKSSLRALLLPSASVRTDIAAFLLEHLHVTGLVGKLMMLGVSAVSGEALRVWLVAHTGVTASLAVLPLALQVLAGFTAYTFFDYWAHRIGHTRLFWPLHRYHHAAQEMVVINGGRLHPAGFVTVFVVNLPLPLLGVSLEAMLWVNVLAAILGLLIHTRLETDFGWIGRYIVQSPRHHRLHHKLDMTEATGFFSMMPVWDRLFGGWSERSDVNIAMGVDTEYRHGFWVVSDMLRDYRDFWLGLIGRRSYSASER
jgi:sterol desaturase/sphingolipid hydroxylase (fatty acid hydroxylase superfamily)